MVGAGVRQSRISALGSLIPDERLKPLVEVFIGNLRAANIAQFIGVDGRIGQVLDEARFVGNFEILDMPQRRLCLFGFFLGAW